MNSSRSIGTALAWLSFAVYLLALEAIRVANWFGSWAEFALASNTVLGLVCLVCALLLAWGIALRFRSRKPSLESLTMATLFFAVLLIGAPAFWILIYFIPPFWDGLSFTFADWLGLGVIVAIGSSCLFVSVSRFLRFRSPAEGKV